MVYFLILFLVLFIVWGYIKERNFYNPLFLMNSMWMVFTVLSYLSYYGIDKPSGSTYTIILIGLFAFNCGILFMNKRFFVLKKDRLQNSTFKKRKNYESMFNYKLLYLLYTIVLIFLAIQAIDVVNSLINGFSLSTIRHLYADQVNDSSFVLNFRGYISTPIVYLSIAVLAIDYFNGKRDKILIIMTIGLVALWVLTSGGGRSILIWLILYFVLAKMIFGKRIDISFNLKTKFAICIGAILVIFYMLYMSIERRAEFDLFREFYVYFGVPIIHMEYRLEYIDNYFSGFYSYGFAALNGIFQTLLFILSNLGIINSYPEFFLTTKNLSFDILETGMNVGGEISDMNAFATIFYQLYLDGRIIGIILGMLLFGLFVGHFYSKMMLSFSNKYVLIYLLLAQKIIFSMVRFYFTQVNQTVCFVLAFFIFIYVYRKHNESNKTEAI